MSTFACEPAQPAHSSNEIIGWRNRHCCRRRPLRVAVDVWRASNCDWVGRLDVLSRWSSYLLQWFYLLSENLRRSCAQIMTVTKWGAVRLIDRRNSANWTASLRPTDFFVGAIIAGRDGDWQSPGVSTVMMTSSGDITSFSDMTATWC